MIVCPKCQTQTENAKFCPECGAPLDRITASTIPQPVATSTMTSTPSNPQLENLGGLNTAQHQPVIEQFSFTWNGGFSYLTYLRKETKATIAGGDLVIETKKFYGGIVPARPETISFPLSSLSGVTTATKINWFDLVFAIGFTLAIFVGLFVAILPAALFYWCAFDTNIIVTTNFGQRILIPASSKPEAQRFAMKANLRP